MWFIRGHHGAVASVDLRAGRDRSSAACEVVLASLRLVAVAGSLSVMPIFEAPQSTRWGHFRAWAVVTRG